MPNRCLRGHFVGDTACRVCEPWTGWTAEAEPAKCPDCDGTQKGCGCADCKRVGGCFVCSPGGIAERNPEYAIALAVEMAAPPPTEADVVDVDELFAKLRPDLNLENGASNFKVGPRHRRPVKRWWKRR